MPDDDRAVLQRLAALEAEVKADADAQQARKAAALARAREQRVIQAAEREPLRTRQSELAGKPRTPAAREDPARDHDALENLSGALELASKASRVKQELARAPGKGEKSWVKSGVASLALGPIGWLYAGSWREAVPAATAWILLLALASKIFLLLPVLMVGMPLSAIAGVVYALQYNRTGSRQRLFDSGKGKPKQLPGK